MNLDKKLFSEQIDGEETGLYFLQNENGTQVAITNYGARIVALIVNDVDQKPVDVVTGFDSIKGYLMATEPYHGAIIGRYANRIAKGKFSLAGKSYQLAINNKPNHLHGGPMGFHRQVWKVEQASATSISLSYFSKDGEENYPGDLTINLHYQLTANDELVISYEASTDQTTIVNLTSHPFFNLNGQGSGTVLDHMLQINADNYNPVDESLIPYGIATVLNTPFDFRKATSIGKRINEENEQLKYGAGYDHNLILNGHGFRRAATVQGNKTGITMEVFTDQPGMQLYSGNYMNSENVIKYGLRDDFRNAFCLETQHFPDSPNHPQFPSTILTPGSKFRSATTYKFDNGAPFI